MPQALASEASRAKVTSHQKVVMVSRPLLISMSAIQLWNDCLVENDGLTDEPTYCTRLGRLAVRHQSITGFSRCRRARFEETHIC